MFYSPSSFLLNLFITSSIPSVTNSSAASAERPDRGVDVGPLLRVELREHVIREIAPGISPPDADSQPRKLLPTRARR